jgi:hypothetical protein
MAYIGNQPAPSNVNSDSITDGSIKNADIAPDAAIDVSKLDGVTATNTELNKLDGVTATTADLNVTAGADAAGVTASDIQKTQYLSGVSSDIQTQLNSASGGAVKGTLTKTFAADETASITLSSASTPTPMVAVTKEVSQIGVTSKGNWDVRADGSNYEIEDSALNVTLTPSSADTDGSFTLGSGSFTAADVGKRIIGNGGEAVLKTTAGAYEIVTAFTDTSTIAAGDWEMYGLDFSDSNGVKLAGFNKILSRGGSVSETEQTRVHSLWHYGVRNDFFYNKNTNELYSTGYINSNTNSFNKLKFDSSLDLSGAKAYIGVALGYQTIKQSVDAFIGFNHDGSKVFSISMYDDANNATFAPLGTHKVINQYDINGTFYDLHSCGARATSYFNNNDRNSEYNTACIRFNDDGTKYFILGGTLGTIVGYNASVTGEIRPDDTADTGNTLDANGVMASSSNRSYNRFHFEDSGRKVYISDFTGAQVHRYDLSVPFDLSTSTYVSSEGSFHNASNVYDVAFTADGSRMLVSTNWGLEAFSLSTNWDITSRSATDPDQRVQSTVTVAGHYNVKDAQFNKDKDKLFVMDNSMVVRYDLDEADDISTAWRYLKTENASSLGLKYIQSKSTVFPGLSSGRGIDVKPDGTRVYACGSDNRLHQADLSTAYDLSTATTQATSPTISSTYDNPWYIRVRETDSGDTHAYWLSRGQPYIVRTNALTTAWDISSAAANSSDTTNGTNEGYGYYGLCFTENGNAFLMGSNDSGMADGINLGATGTMGAYIHRYPIIRYSFTDGSYGTTFALDKDNVMPSYDLYTSANQHDNDRMPFNFSSDGLSLFAALEGYPYISEVSLSSSFNIGASPTKKIEADEGYQTTSLGSYGNGIAISKDGTKLMTLHSTSNTTGSLYVYTLSTPYDLSTISASATSSLSLGSTSSGYWFNGIQVDPSGKYITIYRKGINNSNNFWKVIELTNDFDLTSVQYNNLENLDLGVSGLTQPYETNSTSLRSMQGFYFNNDGTALGYLHRNLSGSNDLVWTAIRLEYPYRPRYGAFNTTSLIDAADAPNYGLQNYNDTQMGGLAPDFARGIIYNSWYDMGTWYQSSGYTGMSVQDQTMVFPSRFQYASTGEPRWDGGSGYNTQKHIVFPVGLTRNQDIALSSDGKYLFGINYNGTVWRIRVNGNYEKDITPYDQYFPAVTNNTGQINTSDWTDINNMTAAEGGQGFKYYAVSTDARTTFQIVNGASGFRNVVRNNSGTWQYNSNATYGSETWTDATSNNQFSAFRDAMGVAANRMDSAQLSAATDAQYFTTGNTFDLAIILRGDATQTVTPTSDGINVDYDAAALNKGAILGTDYDYDVPSSTSVRITSLAAQNLKVKVL